MGIQDFDSTTKNILNTEQTCRTSKYCENDNCVAITAIDTETTIPAGAHVVRDAPPPEESSSLVSAL